MEQGTRPDRPMFLVPGSLFLSSREASMVSVVAGCATAPAARDRAVAGEGRGPIASARLRLPGLLLS